MKLLDFCSLLVHHPSEVYGRLEGIFDSHCERLWVPPSQYRTDRPETVLRELEQALRVKLTPFFEAAGLSGIRDEVIRRMRGLPSNAPLPQRNNGDFAFARLCYALCRATRPAQVLETGVCYGVTTAFVLKALDENGAGELHSIDLPPLGRRAEDFVGFLVPRSLRSRWRLHRGTTKALLPRLLEAIAPVNFFIHDSLHSYRNMSRELRTISPSLARPGIVVSDDIDDNPAFDRWAREVRPQYWAALAQETKQSLLGIAVLES